MKDAIKILRKEINLVYIAKEILISEKQFTNTIYEKLKKALSYIENNLIDSDGNIYLTVTFLLKIDNMITDS